jgi:hypothetical protein
MHVTHWVARFRARIAAGAGQFRDTIFPRLAASTGSPRRAGSSRKRKRGGVSAH